MNILVFDFETTGLTPGTHDPIQLAGVLVDQDWNTVGEFESLIRPMRPENAEARAMEIHGKPMGKLLEARHPRDVFADFVEFAGGEIYPSGWNVGFDLRFMLAAEQEHKFKLPRSARIIDGMDIYKAITRKTRGLKLIDAAADVGVKVANAHDALGDVRMTVEVIRRMRVIEPRLFGLNDLPF